MAAFLNNAIVTQIALSMRIAVKTFMTFAVFQVSGSWVDMQHDEEDRFSIQGLTLTPMVSTS